MDIGTKIFYWERQGIEHTCGIHTLNCILQGPYFDKESFKKKAEELHKMHQEIEADFTEVS